MLTVHAVKLRAGEVDQAHVRLTFRLMALVLGAVTGMCAGAYLFGEVALIVFPIVLALTALEVVAFNDRVGAVRTRDLQRRDRRAFRVLASFLGGLVLVVCLGVAIQAVLGA